LVEPEDSSRNNFAVKDEALLNEMSDIVLLNEMSDIVQFVQAAEPLLKT
jgi:hypothetical protein